MKKEEVKKEIDTIILMALNGVGVPEKEANLQIRVITPMIEEALSLLEQAAYERGLGDGLQKELDTHLEAEKMLKPPLGVSQWREHGKKYGYLDFFQADLKKKVLEAVGEEQTLTRYDEYHAELPDWKDGWNECRSKVLDDLNKIFDERKQTNL